MESRGDLRVDLDDTRRARDGSAEPGAAEAMRALMANGYRVIVWTAAADESSDAVAAVRRWLVEAGVPFDDIQAKPKAAAYIDNKAIRYDPRAHDWATIVGQLLGGKSAKLHLLVGLPGSGKSTFAKALNAVRVSHDSLVGALGDHHLANVAERALVADALSRGRDVVLDRLNLTAAHRGEWIALARSCRASPVGYFWRLGLERQWIGNLDRRESKHVDLDEVRKMAAMLEEPRSAEGFDKLYDVIEDELGFRELRNHPA